MANLDQESGRRPFRWWLWLPLTMFFLTLMFNFTPLSRYASWKMLSKAELVEEASLYLDKYASDYLDNSTEGMHVCLYAVDCQSGRAGLVLVKDLETWDIEKTKDIVWRRRFSDFCPGRTANFGLHAVPVNKQDEPLPGRIQTARWSFYADRFLPRFGVFQSGSFSEIDWEKCSEPYALVHRQAPPHTPR